PCCPATVGTTKQVRGTEGSARYTRRVERGAMRLRRILSGLALALAVCAPITPTEAAAAVTGVDPLPGRSHSLVGEPGRWRRDVPTFARVRYADVYPGVSLVFYGSERELEYDFIVAPGADPAAVALAFEGADALRIDDAGDLVLSTAAGELRLRRPLIYQETGGERQRVAGG